VLEAVENYHCGKQINSFQSPGLLTLDYGLQVQELLVPIIPALTAQFANFNCNELQIRIYSATGMRS
jgi:hypothetical protein